MTEQLNTYESIDIEREMRQRVDAIARELRELGSTLDPTRVFWLECLGYVVDLTTGEVTYAD